MGISIYFRSTEPIHPALAFKLRQHSEEIASRFQETDCEPPEFHHNPDGHVSGSIDPHFMDDLEEEIESSLMDVIQVLADLSGVHEVDWEFSHEYETEVVGRIVEGKVDAELLDEMETVISIVSLFGDFSEEDDYWDEGIESEPSWQIERPQIHRQTDEPRVIKFPGVE